MKPDFDLIRDILFKIDASEQLGNGSMTDSDILGPDTYGHHTDRQNHLRYMHDAYLFEGADLRGDFMIHGTSRKGRELTDILRNERVFCTAKQATRNIEGVSMAMFADVARILMVQIIERQSDVPLNATLTMGQVDEGPQTVDLNGSPSGHYPGSCAGGAK